MCLYMSSGKESRVHHYLVSGRLGQRKHGRLDLRRRLDGLNLRTFK